MKTPLCFVLLSDLFPENVAVTPISTATLWLGKLLIVQQGNNLAVRINLIIPASHEIGINNLLLIKM